MARKKSKSGSSRTGGLQTIDEDKNPEPQQIISSSEESTEDEDGNVGRTEPEKSRKRKSKSQTTSGANNATPESQPYEKKERAKTSFVWKHMKEVLVRGVKHMQCNHCRKQFKKGESSTTTHLKRHLKKCLARHGKVDQTELVVNKDGDGSSSQLVNFKYDHAVMRKKVSHYILINELPFIHVESFMFNEIMRTATPQWKKISRTTVKQDCWSTYDMEKAKLKDLFKNVRRVNVTTDMWTFKNQKLGYMVITAHWIDSEWKLNMRVINFCNIPPPHCGVVIADSLFSCFTSWGIEAKIGTVTVDNAKANDVAVRHLKESFSSLMTLSADGKLFHVRCVAHILNLLVQDGLKPIESIVDAVRDGVKYLAGSELRRKRFSLLARQLKLVPKKLILDVPTRWNSTFNMLKTAMIYKKVFPRFAAHDTSFKDFVPSSEDWIKVEGVCLFLEVFNDVTKIVSGTQYPTSNLFLSEIRRVKQTLDKKLMDTNPYIKDMANVMKEKFDKYWGESNMVMSIGAVLDPRFKMSLPQFCYPIIYPDPVESSRNLEELARVLKAIYHEYVDEKQNKGRASQGHAMGRSESHSSQNAKEQEDIPVAVGIADFQDFIRQTGVIDELERTELDDYLKEKLYIAVEGHFDALQWWKGNTSKYPILSQMARDILAIPVSTVASESTFSAGGRVIEPQRSSLLPESVEMLICGADWARELYDLKRKPDEKEKICEQEVGLEFEEGTI